MPELKRVEPEEILSERGKVSLTPLQQIGVRGALAVGALGALVLLIVLIRWASLEPGVPPIPEGLDEKLAAAVLSRYKEVRALNLDSALKMIDAVVARILLPVFTTFVGFIFGSQVSGRPS